MNKGKRGEREALAFVVPAVPVAQPRQRHRVVVVNGKARAMNYTPTKDPVNAFKASVQMAYREATEGPPLEGPVRLNCTFVMPRPKALVWKTRPMPRVMHTKKPDAENMVKAVQDALKGLAWRDDSQVCELVARKVIAAGDESPRVEVRITELHTDRSGADRDGTGTPRESTKR